MSTDAVRSMSAIAAVAAVLAVPAAAAAAEDTASLERRVADLERRLDAGRGPAIAWSGLVEVEAAAAEDFAGNDTSGLELATLELGAEAAVNDWVSAGAVLLYEGGTPEDVEVDAAVITIAAPGSPWSATLGRTYVPFGAFATGLVSDPLPLELGETQETAALAAFTSGPVRGGAYVFNGDSNDGGDDEIEHFGVHAGLQGGDAVAWEVGAGYISSIADSDGLSGGMARLASLDDYVGGIDLNARAGVGALTVLAEYVAAADAFAADELAFDGQGAEPSAWQAELGYGFDLAGMPATASVGVQGTGEAVALGQPERRALVGLSVEPWEATRITAELKSEDDYDRADGGTGDSADTLTLQLAASF